MASFWATVALALIDGSFADIKIGLGGFVRRFVGIIIRLRESIGGPELCAGPVAVGFLEGRVVLAKVSLGALDACLRLAELGGHLINGRLIDARIDVGQHHAGGDLGIVVDSFAGFVFAEVDDAALNLGADVDGLLGLDGAGRGDRGDQIAAGDCDRLEGCRVGGVAVVVPAYSAPGGADEYGYHDQVSQHSHHGGLGLFSLTAIYFFFVGCFVTINERLQSAAEDFEQALQSLAVGRWKHIDDPAWYGPASP